MGEKVIGKGRFEKQVAFRFTVQESFDIVCDTVTPVSDQYESPFTFAGKIKRVLVDISDKAFEELAEEAKRALAKVCYPLTWTREFLDTFSRLLLRCYYPHHERHEFL